MNIFVRLFFTTFDVDLLNNSASMNLILHFKIKLHQGPMFIDGMVNSTEVVVHAKTNFMKVVRCMSPKVNNSRLYGRFNMSQNQQKMLACFFGKTGHVAIVALDQRWTVNSEWYTTICLPVVFQEIRITNRRRRINLHHDNASSRTSAQTTAFLST